MSKYHRALEKVSKGDSDRFKHMSKEEIETAIADITAGLRGPMSDNERLMLVGDRADLRAVLATR